MISAKQAVPYNKYATVVSVQIAGVSCVVHAMIRGGYKNVFEPTELTNMLGMHPELIDEIQSAYRQHHFNRHTDKKEGGIKNPTEQEA